ncbi:GTP pyrophosphokinase [Paenibacillus peoriae]|uniref:GTP pyrophosphokinase n=1 Tax=Paenibacillus peoriae TaxID=59893 RepID=UPI00096EABEC|nr:hypothetical protein [Paenibacillus peoriae]OMF43529.1 hypothetical protein BK135_17915 [Paenibacillus peoriae]
MNQEEIILEFNKRSFIYQQAALKFKILLEDLLELQGIDCHVVESRAKELNSFLEKIDRKNYSDPFNEITDFVGVRIILYYLSDIERVGEILNSQFIVDKSHSVIKKEILKPNEFGYVSDHYVISLDEERKSLIEWKLFRKLKIEVQVRTVLQHAWASISHLVEYKSENENSVELKRKLYRLAGLIELADEEFQDIRKKKIISQVQRKLIAEGEYDDNLNQFNINTMLTQKKTPTITHIINTAQELGVLTNELELNNYINELITHCKENGIDSVKNLDIYLSKYHDSLKQLLIHYTNGEKWKMTLPFIINILLIAGYVEKLDPFDLVDLGWDHELANKAINKLAAYSKKLSSFA